MPIYQIGTAEFVNDERMTGSRRARADNLDEAKLEALEYLMYDHVHEVWLREHTTTGDLGPVIFRQKKKPLFEGLQMHDLEGLVLPLLSIDEFESQISNDAIVVAFFVNDEEPAYDLSRFIEKGYITVLDTAVSPAPNPEGYYLTFVEFIRNHEFPGKLIEVIKNVSNLVDVESWKFKVYKVDGLHELSEKSLAQFINLEKDLETKKDQAVSNLKESMIDFIHINGSEITLEKLGKLSRYQFTDFGPLDQVFEDHELIGKKYRLDEDALRECSRLNQLLGVHWVVNQVDDFLVLGKIASPNVILLKAA